MQRLSSRKSCRAQFLSPDTEPHYGRRRPRQAPPTLEDIHEESDCHDACRAAALFAAKPALAAEAIDVSELSCKQFTGYNDDNKGLIMMWFEGYYTEEDEPATIDFGKMAGTWRGS